jgi:hypothetical protein
MMEIFINELSLEGQYQTIEEFEQSVLIFNSLIQYIREKIRNNSIFYLDQDRIMLYFAIDKVQFEKSLNNLKDKAIKMAFKNIIYNKNNPKDWRKEQQHSPQDEFKYLQQNVTDTSLAEVAERKLQNKNSIYLVINFQNSSFNEPHADIQACCLISVVKNSTISIDMDGLDNQEGLHHWISLKLPFYSNNSTYTPRDNQTILDDKKRFRKTSNIFQGRNIYAELTTRTYWYIDNLHTGKASHFEVFDKHGKHIGEANLDGDIDRNKRDANKKLKI